MTKFEMHLATIFEFSGVAMLAIGAYISFVNVF